MSRRGYLLGGLLAVVAAAVVVGAALLARTDDTLPPKTFIVAGFVHLTGQPGFHSGQPCAGTGEYADLHDGATVTVTGPGGEQLGVGHLLGGTGTDEAGGVACVWQFFVGDVNADRDRYLVEVTNRGRHPYDVSSIHGRIDLTVPGG
jgi:hypothetical protein